MNLNSKEREMLLEGLEHLVDYGGELPDREYELLYNLQQRLNQAEYDSWRPLSELPPLGIVIELWMESKNFLPNRHFIRKELAESYSPEKLTLVDVETDKEYTLETIYYKWRLQNA